MEVKVNGLSEYEPAKKKSCTELDSFDEVFSTIVDDLTAEGLKDEEISSASMWFRKVLEYNVPYGKKNRGMSVVATYKMLVLDPTEENLRLARILGWCIEILQAMFLVADDIMDRSLTRRGKKCWYLCENVGNIAINDSFYLNCCLYQILKKYFRDQPYYVHVLETLNEITMRTVMGQCLDVTTSPPEGVIDFSKFTLDKYWAIVKWKTAYYSFYLPVALSLYMAGITDSKIHDEIKIILLQMGQFFQVQDDYLDCFGDPQVVGKIGTDIEDNKCSWLVVQALSRVNEEQRQILQENYGRHDPEKVAKVKSIYKDLSLEQLYKDYEENSYKKLMSLIDIHSGDLPKEIFIAFARKIYKRQK